MRPNVMRHTNVLRILVCLYGTPTLRSESMTKDTAAIASTLHIITMPNQTRITDTGTTRKYSSTYMTAVTAADSHKSVMHQPNMNGWIRYSTAAETRHLKQQHNARNASIDPCAGTAAQGFTTSKKTDEYEGGCVEGRQAIPSRDEK
jgi:hypothetical protein